MQEAIAPPKKMRRRKEARPGELLDAAFLEFAQKGFHGARLEDVAVRAGVVKGTIYRYYPSKEALFEEAVRARLTPTIESAGAMIDAFQGPTPDLLRMIIKAMYTKIANSDARIIMRILIAEGEAFPHLLEFYHATFIVKFVQLLRRVVERGVAREEFEAKAILDAPMVLMAPGMMAGVWQMTFAPFSPVTLEHFLAAHMELVLNGLTRRNPA